ncbi:MAG TPA: class I SAM-dependent methyltransferase [Actinomycetota bacterium]|nr:class I SAM-dependent methyltransferase [Actinomycetota bacterium]
MSEPQSVNFDRAAEFYDATRDAGDEIVTWTVDLLVREFSSGGRALEIGVGTGAVALPLTDRGVDLVGMDVSTAMMSRLVAKAGGHAPLPLVQGDATRIPVRDGSVAGAYARHVLHLIADWRTAVAELCRVVGQGVVLVDVGGGASEAWLELWDAMELGPEAEPVGLDVARDGVEALDDAFTAAGGTLRGVEEMVREDRDTVAQAFDEIARRSPSWTWRVSDAALERSIELGTAWTLERYDTLDVRLQDESWVRWRIYDVGA